MERIIGFEYYSRVTAVLNFGALKKVKKTLHFARLRAKVHADTCYTI
jgi:hypothetical protein